MVSSFNEVSRSPPRPDDSECAEVDTPNLYIWWALQCHSHHTLALGSSFGKSWPMQHRAWNYQQRLSPHSILRGIKQKGIWVVSYMKCCGSREENHIQFKLLSGRSSFSPKEFEMPTLPLSCGRKCSVPRWEDVRKQAAILVAIPSVSSRVES